MNAPQIQSACDNVEKFFSNDERFQLYEDHELAQLDYESSLHNRYERGHKDGVQEGIKEGISQRNRDLAIAMLKQHKYTLSDIVLLSELSEMEIKEIAKKNGIGIS